VDLFIHGLETLSQLLQENQAIEIFSCTARQLQAAINLDKEAGLMRLEHWRANVVAMATCSKKVFTTLKEDA